ncbi:hypothetical protein NA56DRAFT_586762 [Hyaloscypha hepaticicola]|uniref:RRM domain-containing protein n=1 Tax=Hyaloscypha hepaticicola TaxID=2082293 RepID=A0A2J6PFG5_9HELO|nr:hypothetical protein NA56DRAFT_586762 [Hyaloscypha hepaticicola]
MELLDEILREKVGGHDTWITGEALYADRCLPGIPSAYKQAQQEERAVYVKGVPHEWQNEAFETLIAAFGKVEKVPCLICLGSEHTFRWAIMATTEDAEHLINGMHGMMFERDSLTASLATAPGRTVHLLTRVSRPPAKDPPTPPHTPYHASGLGAPTVHGHPSLTSSEEPNGKGKENIPPEWTSVPLPKAKARVFSKDFTPSPTAAEFSPSFSIDASQKEFTPSPGPVEFAPSSSKATTSSQSAHTARIPSVSITEPSPDSPTPTSPAPFVPMSKSWATIVGKTNPSTSVIDLRPAGRRSPSGRLLSIGRIPVVVRTSPVAIPERQSEQMRVVFLLNLPNNLILKDVSDGIQEGPLVQIAFGTDAETGARYCGVVFQYAKDAEVFHQVLLKEKAESRPERFRFVMEAVRGEAFPADETIRAMNDPKIGASRRLTMVKKGFFFVLNQRRLENLCYKTVGEENVQLVWLYNGGNATVVFANVASSMKMKAELDRLTGGAGLPDGKPAVWAGLQTTYSKDPCQVPLVLTSVIND